MKQHEILNEALKMQRPLIQELYAIQHHLLSAEQSLQNILDLIPIEQEMKFVREMFRAMFLDDRTTREEVSGDMNETNWALKTLAEFQESVLKNKVRIQALLENARFITLSQIAGTDKASTVALATALKVQLPVPNPKNPNEKKTIDETYRLSLEEEGELADEILGFGMPQADNLTLKQVCLISSDHEFNKREYKRIKRITAEYALKVKDIAPSPLVSTPKPKR